MSQKLRILDFDFHWSNIILVFNIFKDIRKHDYTLCMYEWLRKIMIQCWIEFTICWNIMLLHYTEKGKIKIQFRWSLKKWLHTRSNFTLSRISISVLWFWQTMHTCISRNSTLYNLAIKTNILSQQEYNFIYCII